MSEVETIEELEQIASAQRELMREAANIAIDMQVNYVQMQTWLAENRELKTPGDLLDLQTDAATSPALQGDREEPPEDDNQLDEVVKGAGKQSAPTGRGKSPLAAASGENRPQVPSPRVEEKGGKPENVKGAGKTSDEGMMKTAANTNIAAAATFCMQTNSWPDWP